MYRRRRPLLRGAMLGGAGYMAGKSSARNAAYEADQSDRISQLEAQQSPAAPAPAVGGGDDLVSKLTQLKQLQDAGALTPAEFDAAKQQLLAG